MSSPGDLIQIAGPDGFEFSAYKSPATGDRIGGLIVLQEIFGVNEHIRQVADGFAAEGFEVLAPSLFDRAQKDFTAGYDLRAVAEGKKLAAASPVDQVQGDLQACIDRLATSGRVFCVGYCYGGFATWLAACRCRPLRAAAGYYGRLIIHHIDETPHCPIMLHYGEADATIPLDNVAEVEAKHPEVPVFRYPAGHGFNCDQRADFHAASAALARKRTLAYFRAHV